MSDGGRRGVSEDSFASGHVAGVPADTSKAGRMGTHDYYSLHGLSVTTWEGQAYFTGF